ncbi:MAG: sterol desaturase family protein [Proteobacteria bacterium]|nr:sterol desaturase family protein [Pseudomonadota bacterium]
MSNLVLFSIPAFIILVALEVFWARKHPEVKGYELRDTAASLSMGLINVGIAAGAKLLAIPFYTVLYEHRVVDVLALGPAAWGVLFVAEDFCYYWFHRVHHEVRLLWAAHVNHHSSKHYNLATALRQPLLTPFTGPIFWAVLPLVGFPPWMVLTAQAWSLLYQFWIHTEAIDRMPRWF